MARCLLLKMADEMLEHPSPAVRQMQRDVTAVVVGVMFAGFGLGRLLWPRSPFVSSPKGAGQ